MTLGRRSILLGLVALISASARSDEPDLNERVVAFARAKLGEQVGDGECTSLVREALESAGATRRGRSWGEPVKAAREARPGDVVQFEKVVFRGKKRVVTADGQVRVVTTTLTFPHHAAIVSSVGAKGKTLTILQQNVAGPDGKSDRTVQEATLVLAEMRKGGSLEFFRPVAP